MPEGSSVTCLEKCHQFAAITSAKFWRGLKVAQTTEVLEVSIWFISDSLCHVSPVHACTGVHTWWSQTITTLWSVSSRC